VRELHGEVDCFALEEVLALRAVDSNGNERGVVTELLTRRVGRPSGSMTKLPLHFTRPPEPGSSVPDPGRKIPRPRHELPCTGSFVRGPGRNEICHVTKRKRVAEEAHRSWKERERARKETPTISNEASTSWELREMSANEPPVVMGASRNVMGASSSPRRRRPFIREGARHALHACRKQLQPACSVRARGVHVTNGRGRIPAWLPIGNDRGARALVARSDVTYDVASAGHPGQRPLWDGAVLRHVAKETQRAVAVRCARRARR
jgi:hypothetical protein